MKPKHWFAVGAGLLLLVGAYSIYNSKLFASSNSDEFVQISAIVLFGLGLTVILFAILAIVFSFLKLNDSRMALGLPDGSIRALLAFSLVLIFVCLATYLYSRIDNDECQTCSKILPLVSDVQLSDLKTYFIVAAQLAHDKDGKPRYEPIVGADGKPLLGPDGKPQDDLKHPLYEVTYYPKPNPAAADFAKQIFTTLATIFVSVVSFYFGSSVTASAVKATQGPGRDKLQTALTSSLADSHNAQMAVDRASQDLKQAQDDLNASPGDAQKQAAVQAAQKALDAAKADLQDKQAKVQTAQKAVSDAQS